MAAFEDNPNEGLDNGDFALQSVLVAAAGCTGLLPELARRYREVRVPTPQPAAQADSHGPPRWIALLGLLARIAENVSNLQHAAGQGDAARQTETLSLAGLDMLCEHVPQVTKAGLPIAAYRAGAYFTAASHALSEDSASLFDASILHAKASRLSAAADADAALQDFRRLPDYRLAAFRHVLSEHGVAGVDPARLPDPPLGWDASVPSSAPADRLTRLSLANTAVVQADRLERAGKPKAALRLLAKRAADAAACGIIHPTVMQFLHLGSIAASRRRDTQLAAYLQQSAANVADALRLRHRVGEDRLRYADSLLVEEIYARAAAIRLDADDIPDAISLTDRARGRGSFEQLALRDTSFEADVDLIPESDWPTSTRRRLLYLARWVATGAMIEGLVHSGAKPLDKYGVQLLVIPTSDNLLVVQPLGGRVALMVIYNGWSSAVVDSPLSAAKLTSLAHEARQLLRIHGTARGGDYEGDPQTDDLGRVLRELRDALITPVEHLFLAGRQLTIVPHRDLALIPWGLLCDPRGRALLDDYPICLVPSLSLLAALRERSHLFPRDTLRAYVAADPDLSPRDRARGLVALPHARREAESVACWLRGVEQIGTVVTRTGPDATDVSFRTEAMNAAVVHLATHAVLREPATESSLYFASSNGRVGTMMPGDVDQIPLDDAVVFLAACDTGQGRITSDGVLGLGDAFLRAGAQAVVLSLTKVSDAATEFLVDAFYQSLTVQHKNVADALQTACILTRERIAQEGIFEEGIRLKSNPALWGSFFVLGDGHCTVPNQPLPRLWSRAGRAIRPRDGEKTWRAVIDSSTKPDDK